MPVVSRAFRRCCALAVGALVLTVLPALGPAQAITSAYLCSGYSGCANAGYSNAGYAAKNRTMYWRMYSGHNCTNYVAYRMIQDGMPNERPWSGSGNATNWGYAMSDITDRTPRVGAVAWWRANAPGAGSAGHVAYVEKVISPDEIIVSEDSWGGDFHWRRITKSGPWPTGFIHFVDKSIDNTAKPTVAGTPKVGEPLTATAGSFKPAPSRTVFLWHVDGVRVRGATEPTFVPRAEDAGKQVSVRVTARKRSYTPTKVFSAATAPVAEGDLAPTAPPAISGTPHLEQTLTASAGAFEPAAEDTIVRWQADRRNIHTGDSLPLTEDLLGKQIRVISIAQRQGYARSVARSEPVGPVVAGRIELVEPWRAHGRARVGSGMSLTPGSFTPEDATVTYQWFRDGTLIEGETGPEHRVVPADAGTRITARVTLSKPDHEPLVRSFHMGDRVTSPSRMSVRAVARRRAAVVVVRVSAEGVENPGGPVTVRIGRHRETVEVVDGRARVRLSGLARKTHRVFVNYAGTEVVERKRRVARVTIGR